MDHPIFFVFWIIIGLTTSYYAKKRGRDRFGWFLIGMFFGLLGLIALFLLPKKTKEIIVITPLEEKKEKKPIFPGLWYYLGEQNTQHGPMSIDALKKEREEGKILGTTFVWNENMENWKPLEETLKAFD